VGGRYKTPAIQIGRVPFSKPGDPIKLIRASLFLP
jgi:hypothetical protein